MPSEIHIFNDTTRYRNQRFRTGPENRDLFSNRLKLGAGDEPPPETVTPTHQLRDGVNFNSRYKTQSEEETFNFGKKLSQELKPGDTISLEGDLGTGKTALTKGIAVGLGIEEPITSPTFTLVNTYDGDIIFNHFDVYRIDDSDELLAIGWEEYFSDDAINVVEWGDKVWDILPPGTLHIRLERDCNEPDGRVIKIERQVI